MIDTMHMGKENESRGTERKIEEVREKE